MDDEAYSPEKLEALMDRALAVIVRSRAESELPGAHYEQPDAQRQNVSEWFYGQLRNSYRPALLAALSTFYEIVPGGPDGYYPFALLTYRGRQARLELLAQPRLSPVQPGQLNAWVITELTARPEHLVAEWPSESPASTCQDRLLAFMAKLSGREST